MLPGRRPVPSVHGFFLAGGRSRSGCWDGDRRAAVPHPPVCRFARRGHWRRRGGCLCFLRAGQCRAWGTAESG
eukprot:12639031-Alexandrium_andersonii.AAC.1